MNLASLGFSATYAGQVLSPTFPQVGLSTVYSSLGGLGTNSRAYYVHYSHNAAVSASKFMGKHSLTARFDWRKINTSGSDYGAGGGHLSSSEFGYSSK